MDFESSQCAEAAVKALQAKGIQAQMAKVGITLPRRPASVRSVHASKTTQLTLFSFSSLFSYFLCLSV